MSTHPSALDVVAPDKIARLVEDVGVRKVGLGLLPTLTLGVLAGAFIAFGAMAYTVSVVRTFGADWGLIFWRIGLV